MGQRSNSDTDFGFDGFRVNAHFEIERGARVTPDASAALLRGDDAGPRSLARWLARCGGCGCACRRVHERLRARRWLTAASRTATRVSPTGMAFASSPPQLTPGLAHDRIRVSIPSRPRRLGAWRRRSSMYTQSAGLVWSAIWNLIETSASAIDRHHPCIDVLLERGGRPRVVGRRSEDRHV